MIRSGARWAVPCIALAAACRSPTASVLAQHASLGGDMVARVGKTPIAAGLVASVAEAERIAPREALAAVVDDALAAAGARADGLDETADFRRARTATLARRTVSLVLDAAERQGPPTDAEVEEGTAAHWLDVDLPERMRVIHVVVRTPKTPAREADARALAAALAETEASATSADDFAARAKALPPEGLEVKVERLDPFVADGRVATPTGGMLDPAFVKAAVPLAEGATSDVVQTQFGWHVIRMIERLPEHRVPFEERRRMFAEEVRAIRAHRTLAALIARLEKKEGYSYANGVDEMLAEATMTILGTAPP